MGGHTGSGNLLCLLPPISHEGMMQNTWARFPVLRHLGVVPSWPTSAVRPRLCAAIRGPYITLEAARHTPLLVRPRPPWPPTRPPTAGDTRLCRPRGRKRFPVLRADLSACPSRPSRCSSTAHPRAPAGTHTTPPPRPRSRLRECAQRGRPPLYRIPRPGMASAPHPVTVRLLLLPPLRTPHATTGRRPCRPPPIRPGPFGRWLPSPTHRLVDDGCPRSRSTCGGRWCSRPRRERRTRA
jgi:hypothetical protein